MKRILAAIDFSNVTPQVLDVAATLAQALNGTLRILHTEPPTPDFVGYEIGPQYIREHQAAEIREDQYALNVIGQQLKDRGIEAKRILLQGPTVEQILAEAKRWSADLIVVGHHEHGLLYGLVFGSVRAGLMRNAHIPVLAVPYAEDAETNTQ